MTLKPKFVFQRSDVFASDDVYSCVATRMMSGLVWELAHMHRAMTAARKLEELKTSSEGFLRFFVNNRNLNNV